VVECAAIGYVVDQDQTEKRLIFIEVDNQAKLMPQYFIVAYV
jgi:hypothetical protein